MFKYIPGRFLCIPQVLLTLVPRNKDYRNTAVFARWIVKEKEGTQNYTLNTAVRSLNHVENCRPAPMIGVAVLFFKVGTLHSVCSRELCTLNRRHKAIPLDTICAPHVHGIWMGISNHSGHIPESVINKGTAEPPGCRRSNESGSRFIQEKTSVFRAVRADCISTLRRMNENKA